MNTSGSSCGFCGPEPIGCRIIDRCCCFRMLFKTKNPNIDSAEMYVLHCVKPLKKSE